MNDLFLEGTIHLSSSTAMHGDDLTGYQIGDVPSVEICLLYTSPSPRDVP